MGKYDLSEENLIRFGYVQNFNKKYYFKTKSKIEYIKNNQVKIISTTIFVENGEISFGGYDFFKEKLLEELLIKDK